jgi:hypothetical protein
MSTNDLLGFCDVSPVSVITLPEPNLPPRVVGGQPIPLSQAIAERQAAERQAEARGRTSNGYPFATKREIVERLDVDADFRHEALLVLYTRQTEDEVVEKDTKYKNKRGFMSSHAVHGTRIAELILGGEFVGYEDEDRISKIVVRYGKQLAAHFRATKLAANPELGEQAAKFGVGTL